MEEYQDAMGGFTNLVKQEVGNRKKIKCDEMHGYKTLFKKIFS